MAADALRAWFLAVGLLSLHLSGVVSSSSCLDGTYAHAGRDCCLCGLGTKVAEHCTTSPDDGKCEPCEPGSYSSEPNDVTSCKRCTSCSHPNENLEVDEPCTPTRDTKCRCKQDHYCTSVIETCRLCSPCKKCGVEGIRVACTPTNNTVCKDKIEGGNPVGLIFGVILLIVVLVAIAVVAALYFWKKKQSRMRQQIPANGANGNAVVVEMQPLKDMDLQPLLPDIAQEIGWKDMKEVAMRTGLSNAIENVQQNHPGDAQEQTLQLLIIWVQKEGREASNKLIQVLRQSGKNLKADKVEKILAPGS